MTQLDRIERMVRDLVAKDRAPLTVHQAMQYLGIKSEAPFYRLMQAKKIKPIRRGTYARKDILPLTES